MKQKTFKKKNAFWAGLLAFAMTASWFYAPSSSWNSDSVAEALSVGDSRTFNNTSAGNAGANTNNSTGTIDGAVAVTGGIYYWTVPETGSYTIDTWGAQGGGTNGGKGAYIKGTISLTRGTVLKILVGQQGLAGSIGSSGGGGTFVAKSDNTPLIIAGGGGGSPNSHAYTHSYGDPGQAGNNATAGKDAIHYTNGSAMYKGLGGSVGYGGGVGYYGCAGSGGGGFYGDGIGTTTAAQGNSFINGGYGGSNSSNAALIVGGFGGGGAGSACNGGTGGGGGYSGGGAGGAYDAGGGGGGSYNGGTNQTNTTGARSGHGQVVITYVEPTINSQSPATATKFQNSYIDVSWTGSSYSDATVTKYEIQAGTTSGGTNILALTNKGTATSQRITVPAGTAGNTTIYWRVRLTDSKGRVSQWKEQTVIYSNNVPTITATTNVPAKLDVSLEKRNHGFKINSLKDSDDFNYVSLFADVLDGSGNVISGSKKQIVLDSSLVSSASLINDSTEKKGSLQGPFNHTTPFDLKISLQPDFTTGKFDLTLTKADGVTNVVKSGQKLLTGRTMQATSATAAENYTLRIYPEDRQNTNALSASPLAGINDVTPIRIPFTSDTRNYLPRLTSVKHDVAKRVLSDAEGFNRISVTGRVDDSDPADKVTMYYEIQPKATNYTIQVKTVSGKVVPKSGVATQSFNPKVNHDFAFTYQLDSNLGSGNYALLVYGYDSQEGIGDYVEIPFTVDRGAPTIDFVADYTVSGKTIKMSSAQKQVVAEDNKVKLYFTPNNYATFEYAGYLIRGGAVKDLRIRGAFTNEVKASFIGVDLGKDPITLMNGEQTDFKLGDVIVFKFKATSATGMKTTKDVRILIGNDASTFTPLDDSKIPTLP